MGTRMGHLITDTPSVIIATGDLLRDVHVLSSVTRLNPESPNVVIEAGSPTVSAGGVGVGCSTLLNLGAQVTLASVWGTEDQNIAQVGPTLEQINLAPGSSVPSKTRYVADHTVLARVDTDTRDGAGVFGVLPGAVEKFVAACNQAVAVLVSDYGLDSTLAIPEVYRNIARLASTGIVVWDFHPKSKAIAPPGALLKFNEPDFLQFASKHVVADTLEGTARELLALHEWRAIMITEGPSGALFITPDVVERLTTYPLRLGSAVGAGDILSALWTHFAVESTIHESAARSVRVASLALAARENALDDLPGDVSIEDLATAIRATGGTLVATAGCFDLLHAGHVDLLRAARQLGDALVVLVNSDSSVSRIKGSQRPLLKQADRIDLLRELRCVNAVGIFSEETPEASLLRLRPDMYVKGGDYKMSTLPEAITLIENGIDVRIIPRIRDVSTTLIVEGLLR